MHPHACPCAYTHMSAHTPTPTHAHTLKGSKTHFSTGVSLRPGGAARLLQILTSPESSLSLTPAQFSPRGLLGASGVPAQEGLKVRAEAERQEEDGEEAWEAEGKGWAARVWAPWQTHPACSPRASAPSGAFWGTGTTPHPGWKAGCSGWESQRVLGNLPPPPHPLPACLLSQTRGVGKGAHPPALTSCQPDWTGQPGRLRGPRATGLGKGVHKEAAGLRAFSGAQHGVRSGPGRCVWGKLCGCQRQQLRARPPSPSTEEAPRTQLLQQPCLARSLAPLPRHLTVLLVTQ